MVPGIKLELSYPFLASAVSLFRGNLPSLPSLISDFGVRALWGLQESGVCTGS